MKLVYFAWMREKIGKAEEYLELPDDVLTIRDLIAYLKEQDEAYGDALATPELIRVAIDHRHAELDQLIAGAHEIAIFPPMTGG